VLSNKFSNAVLLFSLMLPLALVDNAMAIPNKHPEIVGASLILDKTEGTAPLTVSLTAPKRLADLLITMQKTEQHNKWGDGFSIDWGDGTGDGDGARRNPVGAKGELGTHIFAAAGTYNVAARLYDFLPTDGHRTYWTGTCTVTVR